MCIRDRVWIPPFHIRERLGKLNQEHCAVYNMMRLAEFLYQYTGDIEFENYRELNLYNGILALSLIHILQGLNT